MKNVLTNGVYILEGTMNFSTLVSIGICERTKICELVLDDKRTGLNTMKPKLLLTILAVWMLMIWGYLHIISSRQQEFTDPMNCIQVQEGPLKKYECKNPLKVNPCWNNGWPGCDTNR